MKLHLIEQACGCFTVRVGGELKVRAHLCRWHSERHLQDGVCPDNGAALKLRLLEQGCCGSAVRGGGGLKVRALSLPPARSWRELDGTIRTLQASACETGPPLKLRLIEQACGCALV